MKNKLVAILVLLMLLISTIPIILNVKPAEASITGPSLMVDDTVNQIHATLGAMAGSAVTVKGTVINHAAPPPGSGGWLTGVFYREIGGPGITPADLTILWSLDGATWWPAGPIWCPTLYFPYDLELIIGAGGYYIPTSFNSTTYIKTITNRNINPTDIEVIVFEDVIVNSRYDPGEPTLSIGDFPVEIKLSIWNTAELDPAIFFSTIQAAINAATPGQTIYVYPGIYHESLVVNTPLKLIGLGAATIDGGGTIMYPMKINTGSVLVQGFTFQNIKVEMDAIYIWVHAVSAPVTIQFNHFIGVYDPDIADHGVYVENTLPGGRCIIQYNEFERMWQGVLLELAQGSASILHNKFHNLIYGNDEYGTPYWGAEGVYATTYDGKDISELLAIDNNEFYDYRGMSIAITGPYPDLAAAKWTSVEIKNNRIETVGLGSDPWPYGISLTNGLTSGDPSQGGVNNIIISNNSMLGAGATDSIGIRILGPHDHVTVTENTFSSLGTGILVTKRAAAPDASEWYSSNLVVNFNNILGSTSYGVNNLGPNVVDARFDWWGDASGPTHSSNTGGTGDSISDNVDYSPWLGATFETTPRTYHVNPTGAPGAIQEAINEASSGDMIIVHDGTYDEQVVIDKSLTLQGGSTPIVKPSSAAILTTVLDGLFSGGIKQIAGIIVANAAGGSVTVKNIIVDGENIIAKPPGADYVAGIFYRETGGTIDTVTVANMTIGSTGTAVRGYGVYLSAITYTVLVEIEYCTIINYDKNAIDVHGYKLSVNIHDNTLTGRGPLPNGDEVQNGVVVMDGATGTVDYNDISNMAYTPETWWSAGIMFLESDGSAEGNIITNCQIGIIFQDGSGSAQTNTVAGGTVGLLGIWAQYTTAGTWTANFVGNTISGVRDSPGYENGAIGAQSWDAGSSLVVTIHNNKILGDGSTSADGIYIGDVPEYEPAGNIQVIITSNTISGWQNGIHLVSSVDAGSISNNNITDTYLGIFVESATSVQICNNRLIDFVKGGIVTRGAKNIFIEGNTISTTLHDEAPNGIDIGTYTGTNGTVKGNKISGCSWNGFTGDYETSWSGSGILVIESGDSLEVIGNTVHNCDVGMDIESDSTKITCNDVHNNIYGLVFWNAKPQVNYNNIYDNIQYGVYRTTSGNLTDALDARYNWWGNTTGPHHPTLNPTGSGDNVSDYVSFAPWLLQEKVPPLIHDVAVISVVPNVTQQYPGRIVNITVVVKNNGNMYETFNVTAYRDSIPIGTILVTDLGIGENTTLIFNWNTSGLTPCHLWTIKAEAAVVGDINPSDNTLIDGTVKIAIMGDMNGDGKVDISDLVMAVNAIPSIPGWSNWNPNADLNNDNRVDIADLVQIIAYCGQAC